MIISMIVIIFIIKLFSMRFSLSDNQDNLPRVKNENKKDKRIEKSFPKMDRPHNSAWHNLHL